MTPGKRLRDLRKALKLTQPQVAAATGVPQSTLSGIERGETKDPISSVLLKLANFYEVEPLWVVTGEGPKHTVAVKGDTETELLLYFRSLSAEGKQYLLARARDLHTDEHRSSPRGSSVSGKQPTDGKDKIQ
jgi:transcriptional regulator with XRE-family HTH domain